MRLEPTNLKNINLGGFCNFHYMRESCGWGDDSDFRKDDLDDMLKYFAKYLREHPYLVLNPDEINITIPDLSPRERRYLEEKLEEIIREANKDRWYY